MKKSGRFVFFTITLETLNTKNLVEFTLFSVAKLTKLKARPRCVANRVIFMVYTLIDHSPKPISTREFRQLLVKSHIYRFSVNPSLKLSGVLGVTIVPTALFGSNLLQVGYPRLNHGLVPFMFFFNHALELHTQLSFLLDPTANKLGQLVHQI